MDQDIKIGTSGWMYDHWIERFYPEDIKKKSMLEWYSNQYSAVEINNTFYQLPSIKSVKNWIDSVPKDFTFSVKASRYITHMKNLKDPQESTEKFFNVTKHFKQKLGVILFQLSPNWHLNYDRLKNFIEALPKKYKYAIELRHKSWYCEKIYGLLREHDIAMCFHDFHGEKSPLIITSDELIYIRFHGSNGFYQHNYSGKTLDKWAIKIKKWIDEVRDIYIFFNNDAEANAIYDAKELKDKIRETF